jgi:hypothetical protein
LRWDAISQKSALSTGDAYLCVRSPHLKNHVLIKEGWQSRVSRRTSTGMPITKLDDVAALLVIDLQKGIVASPTAHPVGEIVDRVARLARAFRRRGSPVVLVNVTGAAPGRTDAAATAAKFARPPD